MDLGHDAISESPISAGTVAPTPPAGAGSAFRHQQFPWNVFEDPYEHDFFRQQRRFKGFYIPGLDHAARPNMGLPQALHAYEPSNEQQTRLTLIRADTQNFKIGRDVQLDNGERLILVDSVTGKYWQLDVQNGALVLVGPLT